MKVSLILISHRFVGQQFGCEANRTQSQVDLNKLEANLIYIESSRLAIATQ